MSFRFLNLPLFIIMCSFCSISLIYTALVRRRIDRLGLLIIYYASALIGFLAILSRVFDEVLVQYQKYTKNIFCILMGLLIVIFITIIYMALTHKGDEHSKKLIRAGFLVIIIGMIPVTIMLILDLVGII